jgi:hypothetical protein
MGISTSTLSESCSIEGLLYSKLVQSSRGNRLPSPLSNVKSSGAVSSKTLRVDPRARLLFRFGSKIETLWDTFLNSNHPSFAMTPSEMKSVLLKAIKAIQLTEVEDLPDEVMSKEVNDYLGLLTELSIANISTSSSMKATSATSLPIALDFMATVSSALLLTSGMIQLSSSSVVSDEAHLIPL